MQRAHSAADFSNLLNPEQATVSPQESPQTSQPNSPGEAITTASMLRPNGPLPGGAHVANGDSMELPRPYKCPLCDKAFHRLEHQTRHIRTHTGEKPHPCQFPGCSKRFSRSDELTRHTRIHNNPNSRRGNKGQQHATLLHGDMLPPPAPKAIIRSAPPTAMSSPNVSPPHYGGYPFPQPSLLSPYSQSRNALGSQSGPDMTMLTRAAQQAERDPNHYHFQTRPPAYVPAMHGRHHAPGLQAYVMSKSHPHGDDHDDHYSNAYRHAKRSRPNSPNSTAPSSPTFSHDSCSPTPDHTPLATPAHSPRIRPFAGNVLPPFNNLSLHQHTPALAPLEPQFESQHGPNQPTQGPPRSVGLSLTDLLNRPGTQRKLPVPQVPKVTGHDSLGPHDGFNLSSRSSSSNSLTGGDFGERV